MWPYHMCDMIQVICDICGIWFKSWIWCDLNHVFDSKLHDISDMDPTKWISRGFSPKERKSTLISMCNAFRGSFLGPKRLSRGSLPQKEGNKQRNQNELLCRSPRTTSWGTHIIVFLGDKYYFVVSWATRIILPFSLATNIILSFSLVDRYRLLIFFNDKYYFVGYLGDKNNSFVSCATHIILSFHYFVVFLGDKYYLAVFLGDLGDKYYFVVSLGDNYYHLVLVGDKYYFAVFLSYIYYFAVLMSNIWTYIILSHSNQWHVIFCYSREQHFSPLSCAKY